MKDNLETATLAGGCFWCTEAIFKRVKGVVSVTPGYTGGGVPTPTYEEVCGGDTGHAEAIQIKFDPKETDYEKILDIFWHTHDPTTMNKQGADTGTQYRSAVFYQTGQQKEIAERMRADLDQSGEFTQSIVTEIVPLKEFYPAEEYHKDYYERNKNAPYCNVVINPKVAKFLRQYQEEAKPEN